jgi:2-iminobutanoate/2-iminopropanoate deaminase
MNRRKFINSAGVTALGLSAAAKAQDKPDAATPKAKPQTQAARPKARVASKKRRVLTDQAPRPAGPYSQAIVSGTTVYVAGQGPFNPASGNIEATTFEEQATQTFENLKAIVEASGSSLASVVRVNVYLADLNNFQKMNDVYRRYFSADYPARTTIGAQLPGGMMIEADCIAVK